MLVSCALQLETASAAWAQRLQTKPHISNSCNRTALTLAATRQPHVNATRLTRSIHQCLFIQCHQAKHEPAQQCGSMFKMQRLQMLPQRGKGYHNEPPKRWDGLPKVIKTCPYFFFREILFSWIIAPPHPKKTTGCQVWNCPWSLVRISILSVGLSLDCFV